MTARNAEDFHQKTMTQRKPHIISKYHACSAITALRTRAATRRPFGQDAPPVKFKLMMVIGCTAIHAQLHTRRITIGPLSHTHAQSGPMTAAGDGDSETVCLRVCVYVLTGHVCARFALRHQPSRMRLSFFGNVIQCTLPFIYSIE